MFSVYFAVEAEKVGRGEREDGAVVAVETGTGIGDEEEAEAMKSEDVLPVLALPRL